MRFTEGYLPPRDRRRVPVGYFSFRNRSNPSSAQFESTGEITPLTQKVILTVWGLRSSVLGRTRRNRNAVTNGDGIFADQNVFNQESHDSLAFDDTNGFGSAAQASKECCEGFCQAQECSPIVGLVGDRLQLG